MSNRALLIGNGVSRSTVDLENLARHYILTIGCNAVWKSFPAVNYVVCWDIDPIVDMVENHYLTKSDDPHQSLWRNRNSIVLPNKLDKDEYVREWPCLMANSGMYAIHYLKKKFTWIDEIHMIGFDSLAEFKENADNLYEYKEAGKTIISQSSITLMRNDFYKMFKKLDKIKFRIMTNEKEPYIPRNEEIPENVEWDKRQINPKYVLPLE